MISIAAFLAAVLGVFAHFGTVSTFNTVGGSPTSAVVSPANTVDGSPTLAVQPDNTVGGSPTGAGQPIP